MNLNEDDIKAAIVQKAADHFLHDSDDLSLLIGKEVKARVDKIFIERAEAQIKTAIDDSIAGAFDREYQRVTNYGEPTGPKTSIRKELDSIVSGYWSQRVDLRKGTPAEGSYGTVTRAEYLMTTICAKDFTETMKQSALNVTGALKDGLRNQMGKVMDELLSELFKVKSLQDQGKVEKPY